MIGSLWITGVLLVGLMSAAATANLSLRARPMVSLSDRLRPDRRDREMRWLLDVYEELIIATATLRTVATLSMMVVTIELCERYGLSEWSRNGVALASAFLLMVVFGVAVPTAISKYVSGVVVAGSLPLFHLIHVVGYPLVRGVQGIDAVLRRLFGVPDPTPESEADDAEQEIMNVVSEGKLQGAVDEQETEMIRSVMEFGDTVVEEIMTPRTDIIAMPKSASYEDAKNLIRESGKSRIPIYDGTVDNIVGVLYAKDLLLAPVGSDAGDVTKIMRSVPYVPDNKPVDELLQEFKDRKVHIAIVLDEYGGTSGLVTIEDIIEELVGDIVDEYEAPEPAPIKRLDDQTVELDARMRIDEVNSALNVSLPEHDDYETVGGFLFSSFGKIPRSGDQCVHGNVQISVVSAEPRRINRVRLHIMPAANGEAGSNGR